VLLGTQAVSVTSQGRTVTRRNPQATLWSSLTARLRCGVPGADQPLLGGGESAGSERVEIASAQTLVLHEAGSGEHAQVLADRGPAHRKPVGNATDRRGPLLQHLEDAATHRFTQRVEDAVGCLVTHG